MKLGGKLLHVVINDNFHVSRPTDFSRLGAVLHAWPLNDRSQPNLSFECSGLRFVLRYCAACLHHLVRVSRSRRLVNQSASMP